MKSIKTGSILFNKVYKFFVDGEGNGVDTMEEAFVYQVHEQANKDLETFSCIEEYEVWDIRIIYETI